MGGALLLGSSGKSGTCFGGGCRYAGAGLFDSVTSRPLLPVQLNPLDDRLATDDGFQKVYPPPPPLLPASSHTSLVSKAHDLQHTSQCCTG